MTRAFAVDVPRPRAVRQMDVGLLVIALQFIIPAVGYIVDPAGAVAVLERIDAALGAGPPPLSHAVALGALSPEGAQLWHMLAVGNVMTLGFLCLLIRKDVVRFLPALPALAFLKAFSALYALCIAGAHRMPAFAAVFVLDGGTTILMVVLALRAAHARTRDRTAPWWMRWLLVHPERIEDTLARIPDAPTLRQICAGAARMWRRILFRSESLGTSRAPVRRTWRARVLALRAVRLPVLLLEGAVAPFNPTGLASTPERITRHLLAAHHDGPQLLYDLELLALFPGALTRLRALAAAVVDGVHPRARYLRDLCVFEGYHEELLAAVDDALAGRAPLVDDPDLTFRAFLAWCRSQPSGAAQVLHAAREGGVERVAGGEADGARGVRADLVA